MSFTCAQIKEKFPTLITDVVGASDQKIQNVSPSHLGEPHSLAIASSKEFLKQALSSRAGAILTNPKLVTPDIRANPSKTLLLTPLVGLAQAKITELLVGRYPLHRKKGIDPTAVVAPTAKFGRDVYVGPLAVVGENVKVGDRAYLAAHIVVDAEAEIGDDTVIWSHAYIGGRCKIGNHVVIGPNATIGSEGFGFAQDEKARHHRIPQHGIVVIEDHVEIGPQCNVDRAAFSETRIGEGTIIDAHCHVAHNVIIGKHCIIVGGVFFGGSASVGDHCVFGGGTFITDHAHVTSKTQISGFSGITNDIQTSGNYGGYPLQPINDHLKATATIRHLPQMRKEIIRILRHLGLQKED